VPRQRAARALEGGRAGRRLDLVGLGQNDLEGHRRGVEKAHDLFVDLLGAMARVDQHEGPAQRGAPRKIGFEQRLPCLHDGDRRLCIPVARQIDEIVALAQREVVDFLRAARRVRGPRQRLAPGQRIDQRRFPDIRSPGEADLGTVGGGQAVHRDHPLEERGAAGEEPAPRLGAGGIGVGGEGKGQGAHAPVTVSPRAMRPARRTTA
jgi:hypothetical protein